MKYVIVWKEGSSILTDGKLLEGKTKKQIIKFWNESESVSIGRYFIIFFEDGCIYDDILGRKIKYHTFWRNDNKKDVRKYVKIRIKLEAK